MSAANNHGAGSIITPEAVVLDFELAGVASRGIAYAVDFIVQIIAIVVVFVSAGLLGSTNGVLGFAVALVGAMSIAIGYPVAMETRNQGRSLGRMLVGTRVVTVEGAPVRFRHSLIRALLGILDLLLSFGGIALVTALVTRRGQRLGDLAAGTMVIRERTAKLNAAPQVFYPPAGLTSWAQTVDTNGLGEDSYRLLRDFLIRADDLEGDNRERLADELAAFASTRVRQERPPAVPAESYLRALVSAAQGTASQVPPPPGAFPAPIGSASPTQPQWPPPMSAAPTNAPPPAPWAGTTPPAPSTPAPPAPSAPPSGPPLAPPTPAPAPPPVAPNEGGFSTPG